MGRGADVASEGNRRSDRKQGAHRKNWFVSPDTPHGTLVFWFAHYKFSNVFSVQLIYQARKVSLHYGDLLEISELGECLMGMFLPL